MNTSGKALFPLGQIVSTPGAIEALMNEGCDMSGLLHRHMTGDWGGLDAADRRENDFAVSHRLRIFSVYTLPKTQVELWIITEADRSATTLLLPDEY